MTSPPPDALWRLEPVLRAAREQTEYVQRCGLGAIQDEELRRLVLAVQAAVEGRYTMTGEEYEHHS